VVQLGKKDSTEEFSPQTLLLSSSQAIVEEAVTNEATIGYLGMGYASDRTKSLFIGKSGEFYPPNIENVIKRTYPLSRPLYFFTDSEPNGATKLFIDFALSAKGQQQFKETGFVPLGANIVQKN
jgi:phosphate transport system substrate-binding protein